MGWRESVRVVTLGSNKLMRNYEDPNYTGVVVGWEIVKIKINLAGS